MADELASRLNALLSDPNALQQIMSLASGIMEGEKSQAASQASAFSEPMPQTAEQQLFNASPIGNDARCELLHALRPFLHGRRADRIESMIRILQISKLLGK